LILASSKKGNKEIVQALLGKGADVNAKTDKGITALLIASKNGDNDIKELLINAGAKK